MLKKIILLLVILVTVFLSGGCKKDMRPDFSELLLRIERSDRELQADFAEAFYSAPYWYIFLTLINEHDVLIKAQEDENRRLLSVSVSMTNNDVEGSEAAFVKIASAAARAYCDIDDADDFLAGTGLYEEGIIFSEECRTYESGNYKADFYNSSFGSQLKIDFVVQDGM